MLGDRWARSGGAPSGYTTLRCVSRKLLPSPALPVDGAAALPPLNFCSESLSPRRHGNDRHP